MSTDVPISKDLIRIDNEIKTLEENVRECEEYPYRFLNVGHMLAKIPDNQYDEYISRLRNVEKLADEFTRRCSCRVMTEEEIKMSHPFEHMLKLKKKEN